jgi:hypothetical protein
LPTDFVRDATLTALGDGRALLVGERAALYEPARQAWEPATEPPRALGHHTATRLADGRVLFCGGDGGWQRKVAPRPIGALVFDVVGIGMLGVGAVAAHRATKPGVRALASAIILALLAGAGVVWVFLMLASIRG